MTRSRVLRSSLVSLAIVGILASDPSIALGAEPDTQRSEAPTAEPAAIEWQVAVPPPTAPREQVQQVVAWARGFAALGRGPGFTTRVSTSADGFAWEHATLSLHPAPERILTAHRDGLALVGTTYDEATRTPRIRAWMSTDGLRWREVTDDSAIFGPPSVRSDCQFWLIGAASVAGRLAVLADYCMRRCCGRVGSSLLAASPAEPVGRGARGVFVWRTRDGSRWRRERLRGINTYLWALTKGRPGLLALAHPAGRGESLIASADGVSWKRLGGTPDGRVGHLARTGEDIIISAMRRGSGSIWALTGDEWTLRLQREGWTISALDADGGIVAAVGYRAPRPASTVLVGDEVVGVAGDTDQGCPPALVSLDGGETWLESDGAPALSCGCLSDVAIGREAIVAVVSCLDRETPQVITARPRLEHEGAEQAS